MENLILDEAGYAAYLEDIHKQEERLAKLRKFKGEVAIYEGDAWHDNFTFEQTEAEERMLMADIANRYEKLSKATVVESSAGLGIGINDLVNITITIGTRVKEMHILIVSYKDQNEDTVVSEIPIKQVTLDSPLGRALYQKEEGEDFSYSVGEKRIEGKIISVDKFEPLSEEKVKRI